MLLVQVSFRAFGKFIEFGHVEGDYFVNVASSNLVDTCFAEVPEKLPARIVSADVMNV